MRKQQREITNHQQKISKQRENNAINDVKQISLSHVIIPLINYIMIALDNCHALITPSKVKRSLPLTLHDLPCLNKVKYIGSHAGWCCVITLHFSFLMGLHHIVRKGVPAPPFLRHPSLDPASPPF